MRYQHTDKICRLVDEEGHRKDCGAFCHKVREGEEFRKHDRHIFKRARNKAARLLHHSLGGVGIAKIAADHKKHRHRQAVKRKMRIALPRQVYRYYHKAQKEFKKVKVNVSLALFRLHGVVLGCGWFVLGGVDPALHIISHLRRVCKGGRLFES